MEGNLSPRNRRGIFSCLRTRSDTGRRRIMVGLNSGNTSREMLLRLLHSSIVVPGDIVLSVHVQLRQSHNNFDPNSFHIHEDLCKSKQVDFEVKICSGSCYITELSHQVRITFATVLAVGCKTTAPDNSFIANCLKALPPTCKILIVDHLGQILLHKMGTSQQGSSSRVCRALKPSLSEHSSCDLPGTRPPIRKSFSMPLSSSTASISQQQIGFETAAAASPTPKYSQQLHHFSWKLFPPRPAMLEVMSNYRHFTFEQLYHSTHHFGPDMLIGESANSKLYKAILGRDQAAAVKVLKNTQGSEDEFFREMEMLSVLKHDTIVQILGYCHCKRVYAIVYKLVNSNLKQRLNQLNWSERMQIALGVARGLEYLHTCYHPIIHKPINSTNIFLCEDGKARLGDFGAARVYLASEYVKYGKVDEKIDVYSYGVLLLELITGKEDIQLQSSSVSNQESLVVWAKSRPNSGQHEDIIDPNLNGKYKKDEMETMLTVAHLCLLHSCTRRPTMKMILQFLEEPHCLSSEMQKSRDYLSVKKIWTQR